MRFIAERMMFCEMQITIWAIMIPLYRVSLEHRAVHCAVGHIKNLQMIWQRKKELLRTSPGSGANKRFTSYRHIRIIGMQFAYGLSKLSCIHNKQACVLLSNLKDNVSSSYINMLIVLRKVKLITYVSMYVGF